MAANEEATGEIVAKKSEFTMEDKFTLQGKEYNVSVKPDGLQMTPINKGKPRNLAYEDIVQLHLGKNVKQKGKEYQQDTDTKSFTIYYKVKTSRHWMVGDIWKVVSLVLTSDKEEGTAKQWVDKFNQYLAQMFPDRPKRLRILLNPASGKFKGKENYDKIVSPLLQMAGVEADLTVLERGGHAKQIIQDCDLQGIDGVISMGGDGTFADCLTGMMLRSAKEAGVNVDDPQMNFVQTSVRLGVIVTGTANMMPFMFYRSRDTLTSTLNVIFGNHFLGDVSGTHNGDKFVYGTVLSSTVGMFSNLMVDREKARKVANVKGLTLKSWRPMFSPKPFRVEVQALKHNGNEKQEDDWETHKVDDAIEVIHWMGEIGGTTWFPGYMPSSIIKQCSKWAIFKMLKGFFTLDPNVMSQRHMTPFKTTMYRVILPDMEEYLKSNPPAKTNDQGAEGGTSEPEFPTIPGSILGLDGEIFPMDHHVVSYKLHTNVVRLFGKKDFPEYPM